MHAWLQERGGNDMSMTTSSGLSLKGKRMQILRSLAFAVGNVQNGDSNWAMQSGLLNRGWDASLRSPRRVGCSSTPAHDEIIAARTFASERRCRQETPERDSIPRTFSQNSNVLNVGSRLYVWSFLHRESGGGR